MKGAAYGGLCRVGIIAACADSVQCAFLDDSRGTLAHARNVDDGGGDYFSYWVISIDEAERD